VTTQETNDLSDRIVEFLRKIRLPLSANEIKGHLGESIVDVTIALARLEQTGDIVSEVAGIRARRYYKVAKLEH
jgi:hypothetical protein